MAELRSAMKEFRFLQDKRQAGGLSPDEERRYDELKGTLDAPESGPQDLPRGFDVNAAAAQLHTSLGGASDVAAPAAEAEPGAGSALQWPIDPATGLPYWQDPNTGYAYFIDAASGHPYWTDPNTQQAYFVDMASGHPYWTDPENGQVCYIDPATGQAWDPSAMAAAAPPAPAADFAPHVAEPVEPMPVEAPPEDAPSAFEAAPLSAEPEPAEPPVDVSPDEADAAVSLFDSPAGEPLPAQLPPREVVEAAAPEPAPAPEPEPASAPLPPPEMSAPEPESAFAPTVEAVHLAEPLPPPEMSAPEPAFEALPAPAPFEAPPEHVEPPAPAEAPPDLSAFGSAGGYLGDERDPYEPAAELAPAPAPAAEFVAHEPAAFEPAPEPIPDFVAREPAQEAPPPAGPVDPFGGIAPAHEFVASEPAAAEPPPEAAPDFVAHEPAAIEPAAPPPASEPEVPLASPHEFLAQAAGAPEALPPLDLGMPPLDLGAPPPDFGAPEAEAVDLPLSDAEEDIPTLEAEEIVEPIEAAPAPPAPRSHVEAAPGILVDASLGATVLPAAPVDEFAVEEVSELEVTEDVQPVEAAPLPGIFGRAGTPAFGIPAATSPAVPAPVPEPAFESLDLGVDLPLPAAKLDLFDDGYGGAAPSFVVGSHRVVVHTIEGQVKRGTVADLDLDSPEIPLLPQAGGMPDAIPVGKIKAIFFMLPPGEKPPPPGGKKLRVTFRDGRQVAGFSEDYRPDDVGFFMVPADARTNTARIWVYKGAVRQVTVG